MAARWMQQKLLKMKKQKRMRKAYLKREPIGISHYKINAFEIFQNQDRVRSTSGPQNERIPIPSGSGEFNNKWTQEIPVTKHVLGPGTKGVDQYIKNTLEFWQDTNETGPGRLSGWNVWNKYKITETSEFKAWMYFHAQKFRIVFEYPTFFQVSFIYPEKHLALAAFEHLSVAWEDVILKTK